MQDDNAGIDGFVELVERNVAACNSLERFGGRFDTNVFPELLLQRNGLGRREIPVVEGLEGSHKLMSKL